MKTTTRNIIALLCLALLLAAAWVGVGIYREISKAQSEDPLVWEQDIRAFDEITASGELPPDAIIFTGSSSIRLWSTLASDMAPIPVIQRGFGGAKINDTVHYAERLVTAPSPRAIVIFAGTNDIQPGVAKEPEVVLAGFKAFVARARAVHPGIPVYHIAITPSPLRWEVWDIARATNGLIEDYCATDDNLHHIDTTAALLTSTGVPDEDSYIFDGLHLSRKGYDSWTRIIRPRLLADFPGYLD